LIITNIFVIYITPK